jgi:hypothetical protein
MIMESVMCSGARFICFYPDFDQSMEIDHKDENRANNTSSEPSFDKGCTQREDTKAEEGAARKIMPIRQTN